MRELDKFISALQSDLNEAAKFVEGAAEELCDIPGITPTALSNLSEILKREIEDSVDLVYIKSEIKKLSLPHLSEAVALAIDKHFNNIAKLRRLIDALVNFYKYYKED